MIVVWAVAAVWNEARDFSGILTLATLVFLTLFGLIGKPALTHPALDLFRPRPPTASSAAVRFGQTMTELARELANQ